MAKKTGFDVIDGQIDRTGYVERTPRSHQNAQADRTDTLARILVEQRRDILLRLDLSQVVQDAVFAAQKISHRAALKRQLKTLSKLLRNEAIEPIEEALGIGPKAIAERDALLQQLDAWRSRLVEQGDDELNAFVERFPAADRQQLRQLIRQVQLADEDKRPRIAKKLFAALRHAAGV